MKTAVVTDSSAGISKAEAKELGIYVTRMPLTIDNEDTVEEEGISREALIVKMELGAIVKTSQPAMGTIIEMFDDILKTHDNLIYLPISRKLSGTYLTACGIANDYGGRVVVADTLFVSAPLFLLAKQVKAMVDQGMTPEAIKQRSETKSFMYASLIPADIRYLKRGGRITPAAAAIANLLKIVPVLKVTDGEIDLAQKVRTYTKAVSVGIDLVLKDRDVSDYDWIVLDGACEPHIYDETIRAVESRLNTAVVKRPIYPVVLAHTGPGTIAIAAARKII